MISRPKSFEPCLSSIHRLLLYNFLLGLSVFVTLAVDAAATSTLEIGYFDANFNNLPVNGSFIFRPSSTNFNENNSSLLNVMVDNRSVAVCSLDLFNTPRNVNKSLWKSFKWSLSTDELRCNFADDKPVIVAINEKLPSHDNGSVNVRFGNDKLTGCLTNFTTMEADIVSFNCTRSTTAANAHGDVLSPFHDDQMSVRRSYNIKCFTCDEFPTPGPFLSTNSLINHKDFQTSENVNATTNSSTVFLNRMETNSTANFNFSSSNVFNETELNSTSSTMVTHTNASNFKTSPKLRTHCDLHPCLNNGTCRETNGTDLFTGLDYHCECSEEYFGLKCQSFNACHDATQMHRCQNNGTCTLTLNETTKCLCVSNFTGLFCEIEMNATSQTKYPNVIDTDPCSSTPCLNNGTCIKVSTTNFTCKCSSIWDGDRVCSKKHDDIQAVNCSTKCNGGVCKPDGNCDCTNSGFTGNFCEQDINECTQNPCKNEASCNNTIGSYECVCVSGYSGKNCTEAGSAQKAGIETSSNVGAIVGGIFGSLAFVGLIIGGIFLFRYLSRSRKLKGKYNPAKEELNNAGGNPMPLSTLPTGERLI